MLRGKKVLLRPVKESDIPLFLKWFNDPEVIQYLAMYLPMTEIGEKRWIEELYTRRANTEIILVIEAILDSKTTIPIGNCSLSNINHREQEAVFGIAIGEKDYWQSGYGTEAASLLIDYGFNQLNLHRITSFVIGFNERSLKLHEKLGFQKEGRLRKAKFKNGQFWDHIVFGLLREEWRASVF